MKCIQCNEELIITDGCVFRTLVGYSSIPDHNHDDNCTKMIYWCKNDHQQIISKRNRCPNADCDWVGIDDCFCHDGKKVDKWPEAERTEIPHWARKPVGIK